MSRAQTLTQKYSDGDVTADEFSELERMLCEDPAAADAFASMTRLDSNLHACFQQDANIRQTTNSLQNAVEAAGIVKKETRNRRSTALRLAFAASVLLAVIGVYFGLRNADPIVAPDDAAREPDVRRPIANLEDSRGDVFVVEGDVSSPASKGQELFPGQKLSTRGEDGFAVITFKDSSRVELGSETTISLPREQAKNQQLRLQEGSIAAEVAQQPVGQPMIFDTPHAHFVSAGSKFSVLALSDETHIEPEDGAIDMTTADGRSLQVLKGSFVVATKEGHTVSSRAADGIVCRQVLTETGTHPSVAFSPDGQTLATLGWKGRLRLWNVATGQPIGQPLQVTKTMARSVTYSPDGRFLAFLSGERAVNILALPEIKERLTLKCQNKVFAFAYASDGSLLATVGGSGGVSEILLWDPAKGIQIAELKAPGEALAVAFSPKSRYLATGHRDGCVRLWDAKTRNELRVLKGHDLDITTVAFAPDGASLASGSRDGAIAIWDSESGAKGGETILAHPRGVRKLAFLPNETQTLASTGQYPAIHFWNLATRREKNVGTGSKILAAAMAFSPDGRFLATGHTGPNVRLWDLKAATSQK